ncbi:hypothetical protein PV08_06131 [Exophiala spinifera]|uniref:BD-FAE-like domain-containing protein n=1 Tax=Exophiala spinifera TaxID=91928 RepID=A0A0D2BBU5_9EURO|nr:uncharacterized protein PV08_06131 [Exophiala spinifera]KIW16080.1 hypothetical protein PV08_06131 [Exophiala spinifera]
MEFEEIHDICYVPNGHARQKLDLYLPAKGPVLRPVIVYIHGGEWRFGSKESELRPKHFKGIKYAVASLNYRLSMDAPFPAALEDCKAAIRWLRANDETYRLDSECFLAWGEAAGGHLAALLGTTGDIKDFDVGEHLDISSAVQGVVAYYPSVDFLLMDSQALPGSQQHNHPNSAESKFIGGPISENLDKVKRANPITYITPSTCPFLVAHGTEDRLIPFPQSELLVAALREAGVPVIFYQVEGADHFFSCVSPEMRTNLQAVTDRFIDELYTGADL